MAQIAAISVNDGTTPSPVAHMFAPKQSVPPLYKRDNVAGQSVAAWESLGLSLRPAKGSQPNIIDMDLQIPVMEQAAGGSSTGYVAPPRVAHIMRVKVSFYLDQRTDSVGRKDIRVMLSNLLNNQQIIDLVEKLELPY